MFKRLDCGMLVVSGEDFERSTEILRKYPSDLFSMNSSRQTVFVDKKISMDVFCEMNRDVLPEKEKWFDCIPELWNASDFSKRYNERG